MIDIKTIEPGTVVRCIVPSTGGRLVKDKLYIFIKNRNGYACVESLAGEEILRPSGSPHGFFPNRFEVVQ